MKYLEVTVTRTQSTVVYLAVDDEHPALQKPGFHLMAHLAPAVKQTVDEGEWEAEDRLDWADFGEVDEREARQYRVYEVPGPTPAERKAALEAAGQGRLL